MRFEAAFGKELEDVAASRERREAEPLDPENPRLFGVAFSGGGIRSATFNLGVLQGLARARLLRRIDYLSTVSGGGYVGAWLHAWSTRRGGIAAVEQALQQSEPPQVSHLRRFSNYLTPRRALFGADTWTMIATYLRNLILTQVALVAAIALVLAIPWTVRGLADGLASSPTWAVFLGVLAGAAAFVSIGLWRPLEANGGRAQRWIVAPLLIAAALGGVAVSTLDEFPVGQAVGIGGLLATMLWVVVQLVARREGGDGPALGSRTMWAGARLTVTAALGGMIAGALLVPLRGLFACWGGWGEGAGTILAFGPPLLLLVFALATVFQIGLLRRSFSTASREWWSRLGAWLLIYGLVWSLLFGVAFFARRILGALPGWESLAGWLVPSIGGLLVGGNVSRRLPLRVLARIAPYVFVLGLLLVVAGGVDVAWHALPDGFTRFLAAVGLLVVAMRLLDVNRNSMHAFYRDRLVRCYLGASNPEPDVDGFTGFAPTHDFPLARVDTRVGPYPIVNTAINLTRGNDLAWQERKAASFTFTPVSCGFEFPDGSAGEFRPTDRYAGGPSLGTAMAVSGAAAGPLMGFYSTPALSFLATMFNVRLGRWMGNPAHEDGWLERGPGGSGLLHLLRELLGVADDRSRFVHLSDGGHFENLGLYELVRRRCRHVLVCDAGQDDGSSFDDLGNAIRKCRTDLGAEIEIDVETLRRRGEDRRSERHCAVGRIRYADGREGVLVYLKPTLTGDEPQDLANYARRSPAFPHEPTFDQWFDESQFESYRRLGAHVVDTLLSRVPRAGELPTSTLFDRLRHAWYAPRKSAAGNQLAQRLDALIARLATDENLMFLDAQFHPQWEQVAGQVEEPPVEHFWLPETYDELRAGFFYCRSLLELMESAYHELGLEEEWEHPDNRGWQNLFHHWSWAGMFRVTWALAASTYGVRFQSFLESRVGLAPGAVHARRLAPRKGTAKTRATRFLAVVRQAGKGGSLNFHEQELAADQIENQAGRWGEEPSLVVLELVVSDPRSNAALALPFGFALLHGSRIAYLRVQDHLRKMGLARRAVGALLDDLDVTGLDLPEDDPAAAARFTRLFESVRDGRRRGD